MFVGAWRGAVLAAILCIAYNTSANFSALEGGGAHLTFRGVVVFTIAGALIGLVAEGFAAAARARRSRATASPPTN